MNIPWWLWFVIITLSLVTAFGIIMTLPPVVAKLARHVQHARYAREAKVHNARARQLRLQKDNYYGWPLPMTREGTLRITRADMLNNPNVVGGSHLQRAYRDRARDLWIDWEYTEEVETGDIVMRWKPRKDKQPKEVY